jgi:NADH:ubiquinone oxidoreductase subunit F (NADH-binding)/Pyruvate/2-oxoacid:ferredoxin oxidoreductase delta subunit/(2Fe-2S) ferredoxin
MTGRTEKESTMSSVNLIKTGADLERLKQIGLRTIAPPGPKITVGMATCGLATGAQAVYDAIAAELKASGAAVTLAKTSCIGFCQMEPIVELYQPGKPRLVFKTMTADKAKKLVADLAAGTLAASKDILGAMDGFPEPSGIKFDPAVPKLDEVPFYKKQAKMVLSRCGRIDPDSLAEYVAAGGYFTLLRVLSGLSPEQTIDEVEQSGLRGRGGAGFPTGKKWRFARNAPGDMKYIICNADEGDPGAYMDRSVLEGDPFAVLEGMALGAYAIGARQGIIYVRDEYPLAIERLDSAITQARAAGLLGPDIMGQGHDFDLRIVRGGGAFVCGEETALIASIEGRPGEPRQRPPFPAEKGLWGKPTVINNVETWANLPFILRDQGSKKFAAVGTKTSTGTKVFSIVGKINNTGLIEVPMGIKLRDIIFDIGGGIPGDKKFKAIQTGGPSGGCIPEQMLDLPVDYEGLKQAGAIMGSGGMIVMDQDTCMVDVARYFLDFLKEESCGKCAPCREGIDRALEILERITAGKGREGDLETLESLGQMMKGFSLCALGQTAPNPLLSTLNYFRDEYEAHIFKHRCPAGVCRELIHFTIDAKKCNGCTACAKACPQGAVSGEKKKPHTIADRLCIKCGVCYEVCKQDAVRKE